MNSMTIEQYQIEAQRTMAPLIGYDTNIEHFVSGVITEFGELVDGFKKRLAYAKPLDMPNVKEEIGDLMWYIANLAAHSGNPLISYEVVPLVISPKDDVEILYYLRGSLSAFLIDLDMIIVSYDIQVFCEFMGIDFEDCLQLNIDKLRKRYPEKFESHQAVNRDLEGERKILEG